MKQIFSISSYSSPPWLGADSSPSPSYPSHHCPCTPVEPYYGADLFEDDYLFLLPAADLRMDPALRPRPVSSVAFAYLGSTPKLAYLQSIGFPLWHPLDCANRNVFSILRIRRNI
jgi:hypothetical protein